LSLEGKSASAQHGHAKRLDATEHVGVRLWRDDALRISLAAFEEYV
jgi:hypothetical protein